MLFRSRRKRGAIIVGAFGGSTTIGKLGGNVFQRGPFGNVIRQFSKPVNPNTPRQVAVRFAMQELSNAWTFTLTQPQRDAWIQYARVTPMVNKTGGTKFLGGRMQFIRTEFISVLQGGIGVIQPNGPQTPGIINPKAPTLTFDAATGVVDVTGFSGGPTSTFLSIFLVSQLLEPSRKFWKGPYDTTAFIFDTDILPVTLKTLGLVVAGTKVFVQTRTFDIARNKLSQPDIFEVFAV